MYMKYTYTFKCNVCNQDCIKTLANLSSCVEKRLSGEIKVFCSPECKKDSYYINKAKRICPICNKDFTKDLPNKNQRCCSQKCNGIHQSQNADFYDLRHRTKDLHKRCDVKKRTEKMLATRLAKGQLIQDRTDTTWKQFWRACNWLTGKRRKELLETWDGYDYIDGEYIKDYLTLAHTHSNYPTLDHIKPRSLFYKEGKTVNEACDPSNLKWTKRSNNSKKRAKYDGEDKKCV